MCDTEHSLDWMWHPRDVYKDKREGHTRSVWQRPTLTSMWRDDCNLRDVLEPTKNKSKLEAGLIHFATAAAVRNYRLGPFRGFLWPLGSESRRKILYVPSDRLYYDSELYSRPQWSLSKSFKKATIAVKRQQTVSRSHHKLNYGSRLFPSLCCPHQLVRWNSVQLKSLCLDRFPVQLHWQGALTFRLGKMKTSAISFSETSITDVSTFFRFERWRSLQSTRLSETNYLHDSEYVFEYVFEYHPLLVHCKTKLYDQ